MTYTGQDVSVNVKINYQLQREDRCDGRKSRTLEANNCAP